MSRNDLNQPLAEEIFVTGYAKLPTNITASKMYEVIAVGLLIKSETGEILEAECTLSTQLANKFVSRMLVGKNINQMDEIENVIDISYFGSAKKAIKTAAQNCKKKFDAIFISEEEV
jgi:CheY-specific phosphatase CheX